MSRPAPRGTADGADALRPALPQGGRWYSRVPMGGGRGPYCPAWWQVMASELQGDSEISRTRSRQDLPRDAAGGQVENVANGAGHTKNSHLLQSAKP